MKFTTHFELHSQTTRLVERASHGTKASATVRDSHPLWRPVPRNLDRGPRRKHLLQITIRTPERPDFKFELFPLHSPLLRESLLVSFPPLIDMLKFSGYPYLIRGQPNYIEIGVAGNVLMLGQRDSIITYRLRAKRALSHWSLHELRSRQQRSRLQTPSKFRVGWNDTRTGMPPEYQRAQCAFKDSMIHWILQFTLLIAFRCVLHRCKNQEIRCWKFYLLYIDIQIHDYWLEL